MIRRATTEDAKGIASVHVEMWRFAYSEIVPQTYLDALSIEKRTNSWTRHIKDEDNHIWVSNDEDAVTGFIAGGQCRDADLPEWDEIYAIYVSPGLQRSGIGTSLMNAFLEYHKKPCSLWVLSDNHNAIGFYHAMGFRPDGTEKEIQIDGASLVENRYTRES